MSKVIKSALVIGAGALAYKLVSKEKLFTYENARNGTLGAVSAMVGIPKLENVVRGESDYARKVLSDTVVGGLGGATLAYIFSNGRKKITSEYED